MSPVMPCLRGGLGAVWSVFEQKKQWFLKNATGQVAFCIKSCFQVE